MGDLSKHYSRYEFACKGTFCNCHQNTVDVKLIDILEVLHRHYDIEYGECHVKIISGNRCKKHNSTIPGASPTSTHLDSKAADVVVYYNLFDGRKYISTSDIHEFLITHFKDKFCFIKHLTFNHIDCRDVAYRLIVE